MAQDKTIKHEHNRTKPFPHPDGWGISYLKHNKWLTKKSTKPIFKDQNLPKQFSIQTPLFIAHARKTSGTPVTYENTHPFHIRTKRHTSKDSSPQNIIFCHNGTIKDPIEFNTTIFKPKGQTDTEQLLSAILTEYYKTKNLQQSIQHLLHKIEQTPQFSGTNIILATLSQTIIAIAKNKYPKYFQMHLHQTKDYIVISSEPLKHLSNAEIKPLPSETIVVIENNTREITTFPL